ncbi:helix-turn-helix domain-containing protein [Gluconobacter morbifer]|uniref:DNA binding helix-turn helix protein n=1 Tax=Gluconobacter morbifer G707 TaxID=1088869 RepID=G6XMW1_9PROT|nr:helix-turn-helix transcriptional regulator [Gluconobacter morbifer]EHH66882.1 DNA binding helix-turn helix protein [Gluconobacter morbifer G707]
MAEQHKLAAMNSSLEPQSDHQRHVGQRLRQVLDALPLPYVDAATAMGVSKQVLRNWMAGDSYPSPYALYRLKLAHGVSTDFLFLGDSGALPHRLAYALQQKSTPAH